MCVLPLRQLSRQGRGWELCWKATEELGCGEGKGSMDQQAKGVKADVMGGYRRQTGASRREKEEGHRVRKGAEEDREEAHKSAGVGRERERGRKGARGTAT